MKLQDKLLIISFVMFTPFVFVSLANLLTGLSFQALPWESTGTPPLWTSYLAFVGAIPFLYGLYLVLTEKK
jgi:hypothetical protein